MICDDSEVAERVETLEEMSDERYDRVFGLARKKDKEKSETTAKHPNDIEDESKNLLKVANKPEPSSKKDKETSGILKNAK